MVKLSRVMELTVRMGMGSPALWKVLGALAQHHIPVLAYASYHDLDGAFVSLVVEEVMKARQVFADLGFASQVSPVILVGTPNHAGAMACIGDDLQSAGVQVFYSYASYADAGKLYAILKTSDDDRALQALSGGELMRQQSPAAG